MLNKAAYIIILFVFAANNLLADCDTTMIKKLCDQSFKVLNIDVEKSLQLSREAFNASKDCPNTIYYYESLVCLSAGYYQRDNGDSIVNLLSPVVKSLPSGTPLYYRARLNHRLSSAYTMIMQLEPALKYCFEALRNFEALKDTSSTANTLVNIANVYQQQHNFRLADKYLRQAEQFAKNLVNKTTLGNVYNTMGIVYAENNMLDSSEKFFLRSTEIRERLNDNVSVVWNYNNLGGLYVMMNKPKSAVIYLEKALEKFEENKNYDGQTSVANNLGELYMKLNDKKKAFYYYSYSRGLYHQTNNPDNLENLYHHLADYYNKTGDVSTAFKYADSLINLKDSLYGRRLDESMAEMQVKFDVDKKNLEIEKQKGEIALKADENKIKNIIIISIIGLGALLVLLFVSYNKRKRLEEKAKLDEELLKQQELRSKAVIEAEEKERVRIARELHDGIGQQLSAAKLNVSGLQSNLELQNEDQKNMMQNAIELLDESIKEVRAVSHNMMPNALIKSGLVSAVREFINKISSGGNLKINLEVVDLRERLEGTTETVLFRVLQEVVNNIIKHANATEVSIQLIKHEHELNVLIEDNGVGFDINKLNEFTGIGLKNIQSRIEFLKGKVFFDSFPGKGTTVSIELPLE